MIVLQFSAAAGPVPALIRWATWSRWSHVDLVLPDGRLLGATPGHGVCIRAPGSGRTTERYWVPGAPREVIDIAHTQIGRPYDWPGVLGWAVRRRWHDERAWFCSELIAWAFAECGYGLLRTDRLWRITPRDLALSPFLEPVPTPPEQGALQSA